MKPNMNISVAIFFLELLAIAKSNMSTYNGSTYTSCHKNEREALLRFKKDLKDPFNRLASWTGDGDCCKWAEVVCDNMTGHVLRLHLRNPFEEYHYPSYDEYIADERSAKLVGKINPSLLDLKHLIYLDLSGNGFEGLQVPNFLGSMEKLRYLNLSRAGFTGLIPQQIGNLSNLQYLDLSQNSLYAANFRWLSSLSVLKHLDLSKLDLGMASDWLLVTSTLASLKILQLSDCQLNHFPPVSSANFSSLTGLDLSHNYFDSFLIPTWVFRLNHLVFLDLGYNDFRGPIPDGLQNLTSLKHFDLSSNSFNSSIPNWLYSFSCLEYLSLEFNNLQGTISRALGNLTSVKVLNLSFNSLEGRIPRSMGKLCNLVSISFSGVKLVQQISQVFDIFSGCVSRGLEILNFCNSQLSGHLPNQLGKFKNLGVLLVSDNSISGPLPWSLGQLSSLTDLDISNNKLNGTLSEAHFANLKRLVTFYSSENSLMLKVSHAWIPPFQLKVLDFRSCHLGPRFPAWLQSQKHLFFLDISDSGISDTIPNRLWKSLLQISYLNLSHNQFHGEFPSVSETAQLYMLDLSSNNFSGPLPLMFFNVHVFDLSNNAFSGSLYHFLCHGMNKSKGLQFLNLGDNLLSGEIPDCWMNWQYLEVLNLGNNKFSGTLPTSMGTLSSLQSLHLHKNNLSGELPESLKNCTKLLAFDVGENEFFGNIPTWIGERFSRIMIFKLRSNKFHGDFPVELCHLPSLQILDLACNNLSGTIPRCINNLSAMVTESNVMKGSIQYSTNYSISIEDMLLVMKGNAEKYSTILNFVRSIDLSENNFSGEIPTELTNLGALQSLNLSHNSFTGIIPDNIGAMRSLESIDFSRNRLYGEIPQSLSSLTFLNHLNLSNNNLSGKIPSSTQIQSLVASCFTGNDLCGSPLPKNCTVNASIPKHENGRGGDGDNDDDEVDYWFYISMALGFVVSFWSVIGPLFVNRRWRYKYYHFLDCLGDKFANVVRN